MLCWLHVTLRQHPQTISVVLSKTIRGSNMLSRAGRGPGCGFLWQPSRHQLPEMAQPTAGSSSCRGVVTLRPLPARHHQNPWWSLRTTFFTVTQWTSDWTGRKKKKTTHTTTGRLWISGILRFFLLSTVAEEKFICIGALAARSADPGAERHAGRKENVPLPLFKTC